MDCEEYLTDDYGDSTSGIPNSNEASTNKDAVISLVQEWPFNTRTPKSVCQSGVITGGRKHNKPSCQAPFLRVTVPEATAAFFPEKNEWVP